MPAKDQRGPFIRSVDEQPGVRQYLTAQDPEDGRRYFWEAVQVGSHLVAVKQLEIDVQGGRCRYGWKHLEDENGFLTDQPLYIDKTSSRQPELSSSRSGRPNLAVTTKIAHSPQVPTQRQGG